jgi:ATP adenylyltransferase
MDRLWAPWRMPYIKSHKDSAPCFLCAALRSKKDAAHYIVERGRTCVAILNRYPYATGHLMIAPNAHRGSLVDLTEDETLEMMELTCRMQRALERSLAPHGYNIGMNLGRVAGAGLIGHVHQHLVPRWNGDTNFMPVTAETKVMPMSLAAVRKALLMAGSRR